MDNTKFTKGKWEVNKNSTTLSTKDKKDFITCWIFINESEEAQANALLISKAPEMLEMLKECLDYFELQNSEIKNTEKIKSIKKLIKEATKIQ